MFIFPSSIESDRIPSFNCQDENFHKLLTAYVGLPMPRDFTSDYPPIKWRALKVRIYKAEPQTVKDAITGFCTHMHGLKQHYDTHGVLPP
jgi:hypothetical protein